MKTTTIHHIVPVQSDLKEENFSFFQGFSNEVMNELGWAIDALIFFPLDVCDNYIFNDKLAVTRMSGSCLNVRLINENLLDELYKYDEFDFTVVWSTKETFINSLKFIKKIKNKPIHISSYKHNDALYIGDITEEKIKECVNALVRKKISNEPEDDVSKFLSEFVKVVRSEEIIKTDLDEEGHNINHPNLSVLKTYGYQFDKKIPLVESESENHVESMLKYVNEIDTIRDKITIPEVLKKNDAIVYCPSIYTFLYKQNTSVWRELNRMLDRKKRDFVRNGIVRIKGYSGYKFISGSFDPIHDSIVGPLLIQRMRELAFQTQIISLYACSMFCPAIRLQHGVMLNHGLLGNISLHSKKSGKKSKKELCRQYIRYDKSLRETIGDKLLTSSFENRNKLSLVCDFPLEWIRYNKIPLMFTHEVSRLCTTPGNILIQTVLSGLRFSLSYDDITTILIIRSFDDNDPIRDHLNFSINQFQKTTVFNNLNLIFVDVNTEQELIDALNSYGGAIVIFDCHGGHGGETEHAWLNIGKEKYDIWNLANRARVPPIIILSACMSHPIDGSHASVATGFIRCGAQSVIGSFLPLASIDASVFVARLLYRIDEFLPAMLKHQKQGVSWRHVVSGFLKMSYMTDILRGMHYNDEILTEEQYKHVHLQSNLFINSNSKTWFSDTVNELEKVVNKKDVDIEKLILTKYAFVETMAYVHLGKPENIMIVN